jgi:hypothetical protein
VKTLLLVKVLVVQVAVELVLLQEAVMVLMVDQILVVAQVAVEELEELGVQGL